ncbi:MAG: hypothetical protein L3J65_00140 [Robiginitomaculum sp.]|nr:hypothetical protein [Robiginitomaculum sp.]
MKKFTIALLAGTVLLAGCSHTTKVATTKPTDSQLSCAEINTEFAELDTVLREAKKNKGASGANIAAAVFFWPAAVGNYVDAKDAEGLVKERQNNLTALAQKKGC